MVGMPSTLRLLFLKRQIKDDRVVATFDVCRRLSVVSLGILFRQQLFAACLSNVIRVALGLLTISRFFDHFRSDKNLVFANSSSVLANNVKQNHVGRTCGTFTSQYFYGIAQWMGTGESSSGVGGSDLRRAYVHAALRKKALSP